MAQTQQAQPGDTFRFDFPLKDLVESPSNPRENYDAAKMTEMVESIKARGIVQPLVVREKKGKAEIVCGSRRFRGAKLAGLSSVPVIIRTLTDQAVLEVQLIENAMREDVHPIHEGRAYARLLKFPNYTVEVIAQKTGHDVKLVRQRMALADLIEPAAKMFLEDRINIGHANLLARLPAEKQKEALPLLSRKFWNGNKDQEIVVSVKDFDAEIRQAGACVTCQKRTGAKALLFDDMVGKREACLDSKCFEKKGELYLVQIEKKIKDEGGAVVRISYRHSQEKDVLGRGEYEAVSKKEPCEHQEDGLLVDGPEKGQVVKICRGRNKCKVHFWVNERSKPKDFWEQRAQGLEKTIKIASARAQLKAVVEHGPKFDSESKTWAIPHDMVRVIAHALCGYSEPPQIGEFFGIEKVKNGHELVGRLEKMLDAPVGSPDSMRAGSILYAMALAGAAKEYSTSEDLGLLADSCMALSFASSFFHGAA